MIVSATFISCESLDDVYDDLGAEANVIVGDAAYTLTDDDYDDLDLSYGNFNSVDDAKSIIPGFLTDKYPVWGDGSSALVTFKWYNPKDAPSENVYELSDAEHNAITGKTYGNFDRDYHVFNYLEATYPSPEEGEFHSLRYRFYSGGESTFTDGFIYDGSDWNQIKGFTEDEYSAMGESYPNFTSHDEAALKIPLSLPDVYKFAQKEAGDIVSAMYELYKGSGVTKSYVSNFIFDGTNWSKYNNVANETVQFGHDGSDWIPDNTIKYTLTVADYDFLGTDFGFPGYYNNFDVRTGKNDELESVRLVHINTTLFNIFPSVVEGQKFIVSYDVYTGANEVWQMKVILSGGEYVIQ